MPHTLLFRNPTTHNSTQKLYSLCKLVFFSEAEDFCSARKPIYLLNLSLLLIPLAEMRDEEAQRPQTTPSGSSSTSSSAAIKKDGGSAGFEGLFGRGNYKLWALAAIILLALWSMFTGTVTLKWSAVNLKHFSQDLDPSIHGDLDVLDVDDREKMVRQMWNAYGHSSIVRLPSFWREAFGAAYQDLTSEVAGVRNAAFLEIAKMSFRSTDIYDSPPLEASARASKEEVRRIQVRKTRKQK